MSQKTYEVSQEDIKITVSMGQLRRIYKIAHDEGRESKNVCGSLGKIENSLDITDSHIAMLFIKAAHLKEKEDR